MGMGQNCSKPCTPVVHIKVAGISGCSSIQHMQVVTIYVQRFPKSWGVPPNHPSHERPWLSIETYGFGEAPICIYKYIYVI